MKQMIGSFSKFVGWVTITIFGLAGVILQSLFIIKLPESVAYTIAFFGFPLMQGVTPWCVSNAWTKWHPFLILNNGVILGFLLIVLGRRMLRNSKKVKL